MHASLQFTAQLTLLGRLNFRTIDIYELCELSLNLQYHTFSPLFNEDDIQRPRAARYVHIMCHIRPVKQRAHVYINLDARSFVNQWRTRSSVAVVTRYLFVLLHNLKHPQTPPRIFTFLWLALNRSFNACHLGTTRYKRLE